MKNFRKNKFYKPRNKQGGEKNRIYLEMKTNKAIENKKKISYEFLNIKKKSLIFDNIFDILPANNKKIKNWKAKCNNCKNLTKSFRLQQINNVYFNHKNNKNIFTFNLFQKSE
jgi:hypothetical protein